MRCETEVAELSGMDTIQFAPKDVNERLLQMSHVAVTCEEYFALVLHAGPVALS